MNDADRWRRVEGLCAAALERHPRERSAFLEAACAGDDALRREVDGLLAHEQTADRFLATPISAVAATVLAIDSGSSNAALAGQSVTHYHVVEKLGGGGMGVVYRADDLKLRRSVALKFLSPLTRDAEAKRRFVLEAQAASALDHPNICTIFEIDETADGQIFIVMAYYAGETLKAKIERGPLKLSDALDYAIQITQGLVKAHDAGIIHRDIKPANVLVTQDGLLKIVDFGLAKLAGRTGATVTGTTLGTLAYMSPEQLAAGAVDARTDLWSLGVTLYEMVAGQLPFRGEHPQAVAHGLANTEPPPLTALRTGVPMELERIVNRTLAKNPEDRHQTAADLLSELRRIKRDAASQQLVPRSATSETVGQRSSKRRVLMTTVATAAAVSVAALAYLAWSRRTTERPVPRLTNPVKIAASVGEERLPSWSSDGRLLAYQSDQTGNNDIWITQIGGVAVNRTADFAGGDEAPRLSPDGRQITFWSARDGGGLYVMPVLGGSARRIAPARPDVAMAPAWSPDGTELAYTLVGAQAGGDPRLEAINLRTGGIRRLTLPRDSPRPGPVGCLDMAWSPDGRFIACAQGNSYNNQTNRLWILRLSDAKGFQINDDRKVQWSPSWSPDNRTLFFTSNRGGTMDLWQQRVADTGEPIGASERLTTGLDALQAIFTVDGKRVAYAKGRRVANVWRAPILGDRFATWADAQQITLDQSYIEAFGLSPDGRRLAVASDRNGNDNIWILPSGGGEMQPLTFDPTPNWWPAWSPDGREIAYYSSRTGNRQLWVHPVDGGAPRRLTNQPAIFPRWSRDGKSIFFDRNDSSGITVIPAAGGESHVFMKNDLARGLEGLGTMEFSLSPDGGSFAVAAGKLPDRHIWKMPVSGGGGGPITQGQADSPSWSPDGAWIYFTTFRDSGGVTHQLERPGLNIWRVSSDGAREGPVTRLTGRRGYVGFSLANDGKHVYFTWREDVSDIWMMDVEGLAER